jgi:pyrroline-5-carboxylate reductase
LSALTETAIKLGLPKRVAEVAAAHALTSGVVALQEGKETLEKKLRQAATPGGIAEATMAAMDENGYRAAVMHGLRSGFRRTKQMHTPK